MATLTWHFNCQKQSPHEPEFSTEVEQDENAAIIAREKAIALGVTVYVNWKSKGDRYLFTRHGQKQGPWQEA